MELDEGCPYPLEPVGPPLTPAILSHSCPSIRSVYRDNLPHKWSDAAVGLSRHHCIPKTIETVKLIHLHLLPRPVGATPC